MIPVIIAAAMAALEIGQAVAGHSAQNKQHKANETASNEAALESQRALNQRLLEERLAESQDIQAGERQAVSAASLAKLSAVSGGVAGNSVNMEQQAIEGDLGRFKDTAAQNLGLVELQIDRQRAGVEAERQARISGVPGANPYLTALTIAGSGVNLYGNIQSTKPPKR